MSKSRGISTAVKVCVCVGVWGGGGGSWKRDEEIEGSGKEMIVFVWLWGSLNDNTVIYSVPLSLVCWFNYTVWKYQSTGILPDFIAQYFIDILQHCIFLINN